MCSLIIMVDVWHREFSDYLENIHQEIDEEYMKKRQRMPKIYVRDLQNPLEKFREGEFKIIFRFSKEVVRDVLLPLVENVLKRVDKRGKPLPPMQKLLLALRFYATGNIQLVSGELFGVSQPTAGAVIHEVSKRLAGVLQQHVSLPSTCGEARASQRWFRGLAGIPGVTACLAAVHVPIKNPGLGHTFKNSHGCYSLNVQIATREKLLFGDIDARRPGSTTDAKVFEASSLRLRFESQQVEGLLLGDAGYPCLPYLLTPHPSPSTAAEVRYNTAHARTRSMVTRSVDLWRRRFRCLTHGLGTSLANTDAIIRATAVLHNIALRTDPGEPRDEFPWKVPGHAAGGPPAPAHASTAGLGARMDVIRTHFS